MTEITLVKNFGRRHFRLAEALRRYSESLPMEEGNGKT